MRRWITWLVLLGTGHLFAQEDLDTAVYRRFAEAYRLSEPEVLSTLAAELSKSDRAWRQHLGTLSQAAFAFRSDDVRGCLALLDSMDVSVPNHYRLLRALSAKLKANALKRALVFDQGIHQIDMAIQLLADQTFKEEYVDALVIRAEIERRQGAYDEALDDLQEAGTLCDSLRYAYGHGNVLINRGNIYYSQKRYSEAWDVYLACLRHSVATGNQLLANNAVMNLGSAAHMMDRYDEAIALYDSLREALGDKQPQLRSELFTHSGFAHAKLGRHQRSIADFERAFALNAEIANEAGNAKLYQHMSTSKWELGSRDEALVMLNRSLEMAIVHGWPELEAQVRQKLYVWCRELGQKDIALDHLERYAELQDSLSDVRFGEKIARLEIGFETEKKEQALVLSQAQLHVSQEGEKAKRVQRNWLMGLSALLVLLAVVLFRNYNVQKRLRAQEQVLHEREVNDLLKQQEINSLDAMMKGQEQERQRVGKDLHDRIGSMLSAVKLQFSALEGRMEQMETHQREQYEHVFNLLDETVTEVRRISHDMVRGTISQFGLVRALEDLRNAVHVPGKLDVTMSMFGMEERLDQNMEIAAYRMVQECVSNVMKHAQAKDLTIQLTRTTAALNIFVEDDGRGFDMLGTEAGMGMTNIRERAAAYKGSVNVDSRPGRGTSVSIDLPLTRLPEVG